MQRSALRPCCHAAVCRPTPAGAVRGVQAVRSRRVCHAMRARAQRLSPSLSAGSTPSRFSAAVLGIVRTVLRPRSSAERSIRCSSRAGSVVPRKTQSRKGAQRCVAEPGPRLDAVDRVARRGCEHLRQCVCGRLPQPRNGLRFRRQFERARPVEQQACKQLDDDLVAHCVAAPRQRRRIGRGAACRIERGRCRGALRACADRIQQRQRARDFVDVASPRESLGQRAPRRPDIHRIDASAVAVRAAR